VKEMEALEAFAVRVQSLVRLAVTLLAARRRHEDPLVGPRRLRDLDEAVSTVNQLVSPRNSALG